ncbi:MAG: ribose 5-phosphate isomerase B [Candidatus Aenigmarchaeota archaeon]|nr:ribose 5-phosphate isomerase B [Candidatus Aenigmarchaeota archaeon]
MKVAIGSDHAGLELKEKIKKFLDSKGIAYEDCGAHSMESCDYPDYVAKVAGAVASGRCERGIFVCKTGAGTSMAANKVKGIRACQVFSVEAARLSREHNDANFLALGDMQPHDTVMSIVDAWLATKFSNEERHRRRIKKLHDLER